MEVSATRSRWLRYKNHRAPAIAAKWGPPICRSHTRYMRLRAIKQARGHLKCEMEPVVLARRASRAKRFFSSTMHARQNDRTIHERDHQRARTRKYVHQWARSVGNVVG
ncbi:unnamed protein product, partial [Ectocarpus sp. 8 AP-2014]